MLTDLNILDILVINCINAKRKFAPSELLLLWFYIFVTICDLPHKGGEYTSEEENITLVVTFNNDSNDITFHCFKSIIKRMNV